MDAKRIAIISDDGHSVRINPGPRGGAGQTEWVITKNYSGWTTRHARNGGERPATGAEMVAAQAIVTLLETHSQEPCNTPAPKTDKERK